MEVEKSQILKLQDLKDSGLATSDIIISSRSPRCYKIYWTIKLKDLSISH